jgi:plastocyanin
MTKKSIFIAVALIGIFIIAGCQPAAPEPVNIRIEMTEFTFNPSHIELKVGQEVTLTLVNMGGLEHELMMGQNVDSEGGVPNGFMVDFFGNAGVEPTVMGMGSDDEMAMDTEHNDEDEQTEEGEQMEGESMDMEGDDMHSGWMVSVPATQDEYTVTFVVTEDMVGDWEIGCFLLSGDTPHYAAGMAGTLTVLP